MNEPQTLLAIENLMKAVIQKTYHWRNFKSDHAELMHEARAIYYSYREYIPLIQAYFDLLPERSDSGMKRFLITVLYFKSFSLKLRKHRKNLFKALNGTIDVIRET